MTKIVLVSSSLKELNLHALVSQTPISLDTGWEQLVTISLWSHFNKNPDRLIKGKEPPQMLLQTHKYICNNNLSYKKV